MADRYWVGGTGLWTDVNHWSDTDGGPSGRPKPEIGDRVFVTSLSASGSFTIQISENVSILDLDFSGLSEFCILENSAYALNVYGNLALSGLLTPTFTGTGYLNMKATSTGKTITTNGNNRNWNRVTFDGVGGGWTNSGTWTPSLTDIVLTNGTWNQGNNNITIKSFSWGTGTATLTMGSGTFEFSGNCFFHSNATGKTFNKGTGTLKSTNTGAGSGLYLSSFSYHNVECYSVALAGIATCNSLTINLQSSGNHKGLQLDNGSLTVAGNLTLNGYNSTTRRMMVHSYNIGIPIQIICNGTVTASNVDFRDITAAGSANWNLSSITGGSGDCGGNSGITFTPAQKQYYRHLGGGTCYFTDAAKWFSDPTFTTPGRVPLPQDDWDALAGSFNATTTFSVNCPRIGRSMNLSAVANSVTWSLANSIECYGSYVLGNNITPSGSFRTDLMGRSNFSLNTFSKTIYRLHQYAHSGTYTNQSDLNISLYIELYNGAIDLNDYNVNAQQFYIGSTSFTTNLGNGIITLSLTAGIAFNGSGTVNSEDSTIKLNPASGSSNITFAGGGKTYNKVQFSGSHTGNFDILGNNTFAELIIDAGRKVRVTGGTTQNVRTATIGAGATITSTNTSQYTLNCTGDMIGTDSITISYCNATPSNAWYVGPNSVNGGNNTGLLFEIMPESFVPLIFWL